MGEHGKYRHVVELPAPALEWKDGTPVASAFGDVYYSKENGLEETRYVFLEQNGLPECLQNSPLHVVGETGFGTGLNFLTLWQMWESLPAPRPKLHFITTERFPLDAEAMRAAHAHWPELSAYSKALIAALPPAISGAHRRWFAGGDITVDFLYGDAAAMLTRYNETPIDSWFLDGFAPAQNPDMWSEALFAALARLSHGGTRFATFTAAGFVKRGLQAAGFDVQKTRGFGTKRDMLVGSFKTNEESIWPAGQSLVAEGVRLIAETSRSEQEQSNIIIGAGLAGIAAAWRAAKLGQRSIILEASNTICAGASANPAAAFTPFYPAKWNMRGRMLASGFWTMHHLLEYLHEKGHTIQGASGLLMLNLAEQSKRGKRTADWQSSLTLPDTIRRSVKAAEASKIASVEILYEGWYYPHGGWWHMGDIANALLADAGDLVEVKLNHKLLTLENKQGIWRAECANGSVLESTHVTLANAHAAQHFLPDLGIEPLHGQTIALDAPAHFQPQCVIHAGHTLIPKAGKLHWGASFRHNVDSADVIAEDTEMLREDLRAIFPELADADVTAWAGLRCTHPSRLSLIGPHESGLYLHLAHGARGLLMTPSAFGAALYGD